MDSNWISIGKKTGLLCLVAVAGSVVIFRQKKILTSMLGNMFQGVNTIEEKWHRSSLLVSWEKEEEEEELEPVELWLLINHEDVSLGKPIAQKVVVINDRILQKLNKSKWVSASLKKQQQQPFDIIETDPPFFQVNPSLEALYFLAVCDGYFMYLLGGQCLASHSSLSKVTYCIDVTNVVSSRTEEHTYPIPRMMKGNRVVRAAVTSERRIYAFGRSQLLYNPGPDCDGDCDSATFGEIYDMDEKCWMPFEKVPFKDAPRCTVLGCVMWHSIIVLFLKRTVKIRRRRRQKEEEVGDYYGNIEKYRQVTKVSYYDLKEKKWIFTARIDVEISTVCFPVLVEDNVFIVQSSGLYRYDLVQKRVTGKTKRLQQMKALTVDRMRDVVYLGSSDDKKYLKFCIFWEGYSDNKFMGYNKFMRFAIIKVGDDVGDKLTVRISSSVGSIQVENDAYFINGSGGAHIIIREKHRMVG